MPPFVRRQSVNRAAKGPYQTEAVNTSAKSDAAPVYQHTGSNNSQRQSTSAPGNARAVSKFKSTTPSRSRSPGPPAVKAASAPAMVVKPTASRQMAAKTSAYDRLTDRVVRRRGYY